MTDNVVTRYIVYGSDDPDDMEYPESTALPSGVFDTEVEARLFVDEGIDYAFHAILETEVRITRVVVNTGQDA